MDFKERLNKITLRNMKVKHEKNKSWPMEKKIEVVSQWLVIGNMKQVAAITGVSYDLIRQWKTQPWWKELELEIRQTQNIEMDTKLSKIVDKSLDAVLDRVENGDFIYDQKSGEIRRKPAALRDIHRVAVDTVEKRELLRGNATERKEVTQISIEEQLKLLAAEFAKWQSKPKDVIELVEVEDVEYRENDNPTDSPRNESEVNRAVYAEREEGLQEGESEVQLSPRSGEEEGGAE
jgi:transposase-like protein